MDNHLCQEDLILASFRTLLSSLERTEVLDRLGIPQTRLVLKLCSQLYNDEYGESDLDLIDRALLRVENLEV